MGAWSLDAGLGPGPRPQRASRRLTKVIIVNKLYAYGMRNILQGLIDVIVTEHNNYKINSAGIFNL